MDLTASSLIDTARRHGKFRTADLTPDHELLPLFREKVRVDGSGCWLWTGYRSVDGYARFHGAKEREPGRAGRKTMMAYRYIYAIVVGPIPANTTLDHVCGRGADGCVNPKHVMVADVVENSRRKHKKRRVSPLEGVGYDRTRGLYVASVRTPGKRFALGRFGTQEAAHAAYVSALREIRAGFQGSADELRRLCR